MSSLIEVKITPISSTPDVVTLQEVKDYCRVDFIDDDALFTQLIASSRIQLEKYCCRVFLRSNCKAVYTQQGCGDRVLLSYSDGIVLDPGSQYVGKLVGESWIDTTDKVVLLNYAAGYSVIPGWVKQAVLMDVAYRYENRGDTGGNRSHINAEVQEYLRPFVNWSLI